MPSSRTPRALNEPRFLQQPSGPFSETWYVVASEPTAGIGVWLRYVVDRDASGQLAPSLWGAFFDRTDPRRTFALKNLLPAAAISRTEQSLKFGVAALEEEGCKGEVEGGGHSLRWRLAWESRAIGEKVIPGFLAPVARLRGSGFVLPHPAIELTGALEVDGKLLDLRAAPGSQAHLWGKKRWPAWAWGRCSAFADEPEAALELLSVQLPQGPFVPLFSLRYRGVLHRFAEAPWIALSRSAVASPSWHFSAEDSTLAIDGVLHASSEQFVEVQYQDRPGELHHCANTEVAEVELRVRSRVFPGAPWRPEATLRSLGGACLEFCGPSADARVAKKLIVATATH